MTFGAINLCQRVSLLIALGIGLSACEQSKAPEPVSETEISTRSSSIEVTPICSFFSALSDIASIALRIRLTITCWICTRSTNT